MESKTKPEYGDVLWGNDVKSLTECLSNDNKIPDNQGKLVRDFYENGFVKLEGMISSEDCDKAIKSFDKWVVNNLDKMPKKLRRNIELPRVINIHSEVEEFRDIISKNKELTNFVSTLLGYQMSVYTSLTFKYGTEQPLHIDTPVFRTAPEDFYFGVWIALEDSTTENGCLRALKGGHSVERVDPDSFFESQEMNAVDIPPSARGLWAPYQDQTVAKCKKHGCEEVLIPAKKGDVVIWHPQLPHGGSAIKQENKTRYSAVYHVVPKGTPVYQADVFFDKNRKFETTTSLRKYKIHNEIEFMNTEAKLGLN